jgi:hypothetical protein
MYLEKYILTHKNDTRLQILLVATALMQVVAGPFQSVCRHNSLHLATSTVMYSDE